MKRVHAFSVLLATAAAPCVGQLSYIESSAGLSSPGWEKGRTVLQLADLNGDGDLDIVSIGDHGSPNINSSLHGFSIWFGNGGASWQSFQVGSFGYGGVAVGDVNNDGHVDLAYGMHHNYSSTDLGDQVLEVALGNGTGTSWVPWDDGLGLQGQTWGMFGTALADLDADGWLDVFSNSFGCCDGIHGYRNLRDGSWQPLFTMLGGNSSQDLFVGDVNNDGYPDFAVAHQSGTIRLNQVSAFPVSDGGLPAPGLVGRRGPHLGDVNGDGRDDLSVVTSSGGVSVWLRTAAGAWSAASVGLPASGSFAATRLHDMDGDGLLDVVAAGGGQVSIWRGDGGTTWTPSGGFTTPAPGDYSGMAIADVDRNGRPDVAIVAGQLVGTFNTRNFLRVFREASAPAAPSIRVQTPVTHRTLIGGAASFVTWSSCVPASADSSVDLEIGDTPSGPWQGLASALPNTGVAQVAFPDSSEPALYIRARVTTAVGSAEHIAGPVVLLGKACYADCNGDNHVNAADFGCFQTRFAVGDPYADCNGDGVLNLADFGCFQVQFVICG